VRFEVLTAARLTVHVFRDVTLCSRVSGSRHCGETECLPNVHTHASKDTASNLKRHESSLQYLSVYTWFALLPFLRCASAIRDSFVLSTLVSDNAHLTFGRPIHVPLIEFTITKRRLRFTVTIFCMQYTINWGPGSLGGITTGYGLDGPEIESRWGRDFPHLSRPALGPTQPPVQWVPDLSRGQRAAEAWSWPLTPLSAVVKKE